MPAVVARFYGTPQLEKEAETAVRTQQNNLKSVAAGLMAARLLEKVIMVRVPAFFPLLKRCLVYTIYNISIR